MDDFRKNSSDGFSGGDNGMGGFHPTTGGSGDFLSPPTRLTPNGVPAPTEELNRVEPPHTNPYYGMRCAKCGVAFGDNDAVVVCDSCGEKYHEQCWSDSAGCLKEGCSGQIDANASYAVGGGSGGAPDSPYVGLICSYCHMPFGPYDEVAECSECGTLLHKQCWNDNGGCTRRGCRGEMVKSFIPIPPGQNQDRDVSAVPPQPDVPPVMPMGGAPFPPGGAMGGAPMGGAPMGGAPMGGAPMGGAPMGGAPFSPGGAMGGAPMGTAPMPPGPSPYGGGGMPPYDNGMNVLGGADEKPPKKRRFSIKKLVLIYGSVLMAGVLVIGILFATKVLCIHKWDAATCTEPEICERCGKERGEPAGHQWDAGSCTQPKTCTVCGATSGSPLGHKWLDATCDQPKTCSRCGRIEGRPLGHKWGEATCTEPKKCERCGLSKGKAKGHKWKDATCTEPQICSRCGKTKGKPLGHSWRPATVDDPKTCTRCGATEGQPLDYREIGYGVVITDDGDGLNLRAEASANADVITTMDDTQVIHLYDCRKSGWYYVKTDGGNYGYAKQEFITKISNMFNGMGLDKIICYNVDHSGPYEALGFYSDSSGGAVVIYRKNGSSDAYTYGRNEGYHIIRDNNSGSTYFGYVYNSGTSGEISRVEGRTRYPVKEYSSFSSFGSSRANSAKSAFDTYYNNIDYIENETSFSMTV